MKKKYFSLESHYNSVAYPCSIIEIDSLSITIIHTFFLCLIKKKIKVNRIKAIYRDRWFLRNCITFEVWNKKGDTDLYRIFYVNRREEFISHIKSLNILGTKLD